MMKKNIFIISIIFFITITMFIAILFNNKHSLPNIVLPGTAEPLPDKKNLIYNYNVLTKSISSEKYIDVYKVIPKKINKSEFINFSKKFGQKTVESRVSKGTIGFTFIDETSNLNYDNFGFMAYNKRKNYSRFNKVLPEENEAKLIAEDFLKSNGLLTSEYYFVSAGDGLVSEYGDGKIIVENKSVIFQRKINGIEILGASTIQVDIGSNDDVENVSMHNYDIEYHDNIKLKSIDDAFIDLKAGKGMEVFGGNSYNETNPLECNVEEADIAYYVTPYKGKNDFLYPVYKFKGKVNKKKISNTLMKDVKSVIEDNYVGIIQAY